MSNKLALLKNLLIDRDEVVILHQGKAHCGCGEAFDEFSDIENHLVQKHEKLSSSSRHRRSLGDILKCVVVNQLSAQRPPPSLAEQQLEVKVPEKCWIKF